MGSEAYSEEEVSALQTVAASDYRKRVLQALDGRGPSTPTKLVERTGIDPSHVSRVLNDLREVECAELIVPENTKKGRIYAATDRAETVLSVVCDGEE